MFGLGKVVSEALGDILDDRLEDRKCYLTAVRDGQPKGLLCLLTKAEHTATGQHLENSPGSRATQP